MTYLEKRIPPPLVMVITAILMWAVAQITPVVKQHSVIVLLLFLLAFAISFSGVRSFQRAKTTVNPLKPEAASALVTSGVYRYTRNPMYLGFALLLSAWAFYLQAPMAFVGVAIFILYIHRFQILPEQQALEALFGEDFTAYKERVRPWI